MTQTDLSRKDFHALIAQQGLTYDDAELAEFYEAYGLVRAMAARVRKPRTHMAEPMAIFAPVQPSST
ncbi:hypothetical protein [Roseinatronobacter sp. NSM]|uniref:hypothetical protein n=1 Tax=Roseinatronobacter sp. NSM TaxID=3457785 RepID=UPI004035FE79